MSPCPLWRAMLLLLRMQKARHPWGSAVGVSLRVLPEIMLPLALPPHGAADCSAGAPWALGSDCRALIPH